MTCAELEHVLPEIVEGVRTAEQEAHLRACPECAGVVADLHLIAQRARGLQASEEPHPRVWKAISGTVHEWQADLDLISAKARLLQASEEPSPRVWNSIQATLNTWQSELSQISEQCAALPDAEPSPRVWNSLEAELRKEGLIRRPERLVAAGTSRGWRWAWLAPVAAALLVVGVTLYERGDVAGPVRPASFAQLPANSAASDDQQMLEAVASRAPAMRALYESNLRSVNAYIRDAEQSVKNDPNDAEAQESLVNAYDQKSMLYEMALDRSLP